MTVIGIVVRPSSRPKIACVLLGGSQEAPEVIDGFDLTTSDDVLVDQIDHLGKSLSSKLSGSHVESAIIRVADFSKMANRRAASDTRLLLEGTAAFVCRGRLPGEVHLRPGKQVGEHLGLSKAQADALGQRLDRQRFEAAAAAASGLPRTASMREG